MCNDPNTPYNYPTLQTVETPEAKAIEKLIILATDLGKTYSTGYSNPDPRVQKQCANSFQYILSELEKVRSQLYLIKGINPLPFRPDRYLMPDRRNGSINL